MSRFRIHIYTHSYFHHFNDRCEMHLHNAERPLQYAKAQLTDTLE